MVVSLLGLLPHERFKTEKTRTYIWKQQLTYTFSLVIKGFVASEKRSRIVRTNMVFESNWFWVCILLATVDEPRDLRRLTVGIVFPK